MELKIFFDPKYWYTAHIEEIWLITEWDNFDNLMKNIYEALSLYDEIQTRNIKFTLVFNKNSNILQTNS